MFNITMRIQPMGFSFLEIMNHFVKLFDENIKFFMLAELCVGEHFLCNGTIKMSA